MWLCVFRSTLVGHFCALHSASDRLTDSASMPGGSSPAHTTISGTDDFNSAGCGESAAYLDESSPKYALKFAISGKTLRSNGVPDSRIAPASPLPGAV